MSMKTTRKGFWLLASPLLVIALAFFLSSVNNFLIRQEENAQIKPTLNPNGSVMVSRQRLVDGSIQEFLYAPNGSKRVLAIQPADMVNKPRGLFETRYLACGVVLLYGLVVAVALSLPVSVVPMWLRRRRNQTQ